MNLAIIGFGRLGKAIFEHAGKDRTNSVSIIDPYVDTADFKYVDEESMKGVEVCIDCSIPNVVVKNIEAYIQLKKNSVIATTGWYAELERVAKLVKENGIGLVWSPNFSLGASIFLRIVEHAATVINKIERYDVYCQEIHHKIKKDSPSGNARIIGDTLLTNITRKRMVVYETLNRKLHDDEINFTSVRGGYAAGTHNVYFESECDVLRLEHIMKTKDGLAQGALLAAKWISDKKGFYDIYDLVDFFIEEGEQAVDERK